MCEERTTIIIPFVSLSYDSWESCPPHSIFLAPCLQSPVMWPPHVVHELMEHSAKHLIEGQEGEGVMRRPQSHLKA